MWWHLSRSGEPLYKYLGEGLSRWENQTSEVQNSKYQKDRGAGSTVMKGRYQERRAKWAPGLNWAELVCDDKDSGTDSEWGGSPEAVGQSCRAGKWHELTHIFKGSLWILWGKRGKSGSRESDEDVNAIIQVRGGDGLCSDEGWIGGRSLFPQYTLKADLIDRFLMLEVALTV